LRNRFELTFVSSSQAILRDLKSTTNADQKGSKEKNEDGKEEPPNSGRLNECVLRSKKGAELGEVRILGREQRYAIAYTPNTLILADMQSGLVSGMGRKIKENKLLETGQYNVKTQYFLIFLTFLFIVYFNRVPKLFGNRVGTRNSTWTMKT
jgi:hypothetical protein